jgi:hypothetical protein
MNSQDSFERGERAGASDKGARSWYEYEDERSSTLSPECRVTRHDTTAHPTFSPGPFPSFPRAPLPSRDLLPPRLFFPARRHRTIEIGERTIVGQSMSSKQVYTADTQVSHRVTANHDLQHPYPSPHSSTGITNSTPGNRAHRRQAISSGPEKAIRRCIDGVMTKITIPRVRALYPIMQIDRSARGRQFHRERSIDSAPFEDHVSCQGSRFSTSGCCRIASCVHRCSCFDSVSDVRSVTSSFWDRPRAEAINDFTTQRGGNVTKTGLPHISSSSTQMLKVQMLAVSHPSTFR